MQLGFMNTGSHFNSEIATSGNSFVAMQIFLIHKGSRVKINMQINSSITHWLQAISKFSLVTETRDIILALRGCQSYLFR